jgi:hypothetical protein
VTAGAGLDNAMTPVGTSAAPEQAGAVAAIRRTMAARRTSVTLTADYHSGMGEPLKRLSVQDEADGLEGP